MRKVAVLNNPKFCPYRIVEEGIVTACGHPSEKIDGYIRLCNCEDDFTEWCPLQDYQPSEQEVYIQQKLEEAKRLAEAKQKEIDEQRQKQEEVKPVEVVAEVVEGEKPNPNPNITKNSDDLHSVVTPMTAQQEAIPKKKEEVTAYRTSDGVVIVDKRPSVKPKKETHQQNWTDEETCLLMVCKTLDEARDRYITRFGWKRSVDSIRHKYNALDRAGKLLVVGDKVTSDKVKIEGDGVLSSISDDKIYGIVTYGKTKSVVSIPLVDLKKV